MAQPLSKPFYRSAIASFVIVTVCMIAFLFHGKVPAFSAGLNVHLTSTSDHRGSLNGPLPETDGNVFERLNLDEKECKAKFPGFARDIDDMILRGRFVFTKTKQDYQGLVQGRIKGGKLYIIATAPASVSDVLQQRTAVLHQLHRALITSPSPVPDTYFAFVINDSPKNNSWAFAKPNKPGGGNTWLMPHFGFWSWPSANLDSMDSVQSRIETVESTTTWSDKIDKVVWRGTPWFNPVGHPRLRQDLIRVTQGKEWADVEKLEVDIGGKHTNFLELENFCKYKYVVYTEGVTYSGRLPYHQTCNSILLTAPLSYLTTTAWLIKPIDAGTLLSDFKAADSKDEEATAKSSSTWTSSPLLEPTSYWKEANAIYVSSDFSNLEATIRMLRFNPDIARHISNNQRRTIVEGGFLSPAAEACYWRALVRGWASVAITEAEEWGDATGERFESWILKEVVERRSGTRGKIGGK